MLPPFVESSPRWVVEETANWLWHWYQNLIFYFEIFAPHFIFHLFYYTWNENRNRNKKECERFESKKKTQMHNRMWFIPGFACYNTRLWIIIRKAGKCSTVGIWGSGCGCGCGTVPNLRYIIHSRHRTHYKIYIRAPSHSSFFFSFIFILSRKHSKSTGKEEVGE